MRYDDVMRRRAMYRWKSFWLGLMVLAFLGWAWARSMSREEGMTRRGPGTGFIEAGVYQGVFRVIEGESELDRDSASVTWQSEEFPRRMDEEPRRWAFRTVMEDSYLMRKWWIAFPMWVPMAMWLAVWGGWLLWWRRRVTRLTETGVAG